MARAALVSVVIPVLNEAECVARLHLRLASVCAGLSERFEFIFVDDGSSDATAERLARLRRDDGRVRYLVLSRNFGHQSALSAGLDHAAGDAVIMMDGDLQHPPELIPVLLERWREGFDVVNAVRLQTESISASKRLLSRWFYRTFNALASVKLDPGVADFRLVSRAGVDVLKALPERHRFYRGLVPWMGFPQARVSYEAPARWAGRSKFTFRRSLRLAVDGITAFSVRPLRCFAVLGVALVFWGLLLAAFAIGLLTGSRTAAASWLAILSLVLTLSGSQSLGLGLLGEYVGRTLEEVKGRPLYVVRDSAGFATLARPRAAHSGPHFPLGDAAARAGEASEGAAELQSS